MSVFKENMGDDTTFDQLVDCIISGIKGIRLPDASG
jgi:hypothetical protein